MGTKLFINLPVANLAKSKTFFTTLGFSFNPIFSDDNAQCMQINDQGFVILVKREQFTKFTAKQITDPYKSAQVIVSPTFEDRNSVDRIADLALANGGSKAGEPVDDGFMYMRQIHDLDGHIWELCWVDTAAFGQ